MERRRVSWRDRYPDEVTCVRCLEVRDQMFLDRLLWCDQCRQKARARAAWWGWLGGLVFAAGVGAYVFLVIRPTLIIGAWIATVVAAVWLGQKVAREFAYGVMRFKNRRAVEAVPPPVSDTSAPGPDGDSSESDPPSPGRELDQ